VIQAADQRSTKKLCRTASRDIELLKFVPVLYIYHSPLRFGADLAIMRRVNDAAGL
jgi:hypothetical protein